MFADLALLNGKIVTVDEKESIAEAVAVKFNRIIAVGEKDEIMALTGDSTKLVDLQGRTVIPGLIDTNCHSIQFGAYEAMPILVDLSEEAGIRSVADIKAKIAERAKIIPAGEFIIGDLEDETKLLEKRHPSRRELDEAAPDHRVVVHTVGGHFALANSKALEKAGVAEDTPDPPGGKYERDPETGEFTGAVYANARDVILPGGEMSRDPTRDETYEGSKRVLRANAAAGLTCIVETAGSPTMQGAVMEMRNRGELPIRVRMDFWRPVFPRLSSVGNYRGLGDEWFKIGGLKLFFDGAVSARTAAVSEPYLHVPGYRGEITITKEKAKDEIEQAYAVGYRILAHANGDVAIKMYLDIMEEIQKKYPREDPRNKIIHCTVVNPELVMRIKELGMLPTIFGPYPYYHGDKIMPAFGEKRLEWMFAARSFLDAGVKVAAHSDYAASPFPPLMGIHALVNRRTKAGKPIGPSQRISVMEALKLYTINAAYHSFDENALGSLEVGKYADMVVLGEDILTVPPERIIDIPIDMTIVGGNVVYERRSS